MGEKVLIKKILQNRNNQILLVIATAIILMNVVGANSPNVTIEPSAPYTTETMICNFTFTGHDDYEINWYRNGALIVENSSSLSSSNTTKQEIWTCEVITYLEGTPNDLGNRSVTIRNSAPVDLKIYHNGVELQDYHELNEDEVYNLLFNATDPDGDTLIYLITDTTGRDLCPTLNANTGQLTCLPTHFTLSGTESPAEEYPLNYTIRLRAEESASEGFSAFRDFTFTIIPVNDQARFITEIPDLSIDALSPWEYLITAYDEELDYPLNFSISTHQGLGLVLMEPSTNTDTSVILSFDEGKPTNDDVGNWTITLYVTDVNGSNMSRPPSSQTFNLQINRTNEIPYIITNLSNITGTQGNLFNLSIEARDADENDTLSFILSLRLNQTADPGCTAQYFVWNQNITTVLNASHNALATINITNLTNNHVICRSATLEVRDQDGSSSSIPIFFNITNINDPPEIHEISNYENNIGGQTNMSNISVSLFVSPAIYKVNATDPDQLTYDALNTGILSYTVNDSGFIINSETGIMNLTFLGSGMIGTHTVLVTATDNGGLNNSRIMNIEILPNDPPTIEVPEGLTFLQNDEIIIPFNTTDNDGDSVYLSITSNNPRFSNEIYALAQEQISTTHPGIPSVTNWQMDLSNWILNKTMSHPVQSRPNSTLYANELVGTHNITITVYDQHDAYNESSIANLIFVVENENDAPFFDMRPRNNVSDTLVTFNNMAVGKTRTEILYATDFDLFITNSTEILTYSVMDHSPNITIISFNKHIGYEDTTTLTFRPDFKGYHYIIVQVNDSQGASSNQLINFTVYEETNPPEFIQISPYYSGGQTNQGFRSTVGLDPTQPVHITWQENATLTFDADISLDDQMFINDPEEGEPNSLNTKLYVNGILVSQKTDVTPMVNSAYTVYFDFFSEGVNTVTMEAIDAVESSSNWTWSVEVENINRLPIYCEGSLNDITFSGSISWPNYFSYFSHQRFYDPDDDSLNPGPANIDPCVSNFRGVDELPSLTYTYTTVRGNCDAEFIFDDATITIKGYAIGMCHVVFTATDEYGESVESDEVIIEILEAITEGEVTTERTITITETITIPIEQDVDVPQPTKIIYPGEAIFYQNQTIEVPLIIRNNWTEELIGITLSGSLLNTTSILKDENISISFSTTQISSLAIGAQQEVTMLLTNYRKPGPILINVFAEVSNPKFTDAEIIIIAGLELMGDDPQTIRALVTYARDLLTTSPQCAELNDLLDNAQRVLEQGQADEALRLIDAAINGCRYLMSQDELLRREQPGVLKSGLDFTSEYWSEIIVGSIAFIFIAIAFYVVAFIKLSLKDRKN